MDFVCFEKDKIIEVDRGQHSESVDSGRDAWLRSQAFAVLRFWNHDVLHNINGVVEIIRERCLSHPPIKGGAT